MNTIDIIKNRYSTVLFDPGPVEDDIIYSLFEAARWAPSSRNIQPWRFYFCMRGSQSFNECISLMTDSNQLWAKHASLIIFTVSELSGERGINRSALHDTGMATSNLLLQAASLGLATHPMGGFDAQKAKEFLKLTANYEPVTMIAVGYPGNIEKAENDLKQKELERRIRKHRDLRETAFKIG